MAALDSDTEHDRTQSLDGSLRSTFETWYPGMANDNHRNSGNRAAA